ncbi:polysaccharide lyase 8 family protein [Enterococcus sp.]|uniref:polysaccharide lyase 8 family protein n=1 Tax=Enterococcus sp. TaxID=35783 RepID=UPI00399219E2
MKNKIVVKSLFVLALLSSTSLNALAEEPESVNEAEQSIDKTAIQSDDNQGNSNLVQNGDFSNIESQEGKWSGNKPSSWGIWIPRDMTSTDYTAEVNANNQIVLSSLKDDFRVGITQKIEVDPNKLYQLSFKVKTDELTNVARVRINEQNENGQTNLWYSKSVKGTTDWQTITQDFEPNPETSFVTIELFFEKGIGTLYYDDVSFLEKQIEEDDGITIEDKIEINTNNIYVTKQENYKYVVSDSSLATEEEGMLYPVKEGETTVKILDEKGIFMMEIPLVISSYNETKFNKMLNQWNGIIAGNSYYNDNNDVMVQQNKDLDSSAENIISLYTYKENFKTLWSDITDYKVSANITESYRRIETISKQVTQPASKYYQDKEVIRIAKNAMEWMSKNVYNENSSLQGNWWDYEIGAPRAINNTLSLMQAYFTQSEILMYTNPINYFVPDPYNFRVTLGTPFKALGGNLVDMGRVKIISGALREDGDIVSKSVESLQQAFEYAKPGESGFYEDGSYIDHDNVALTGAYGSVLIDGLSQLLPVVLESELLPVSKLDNLYNFIENSFIPLMYKGEMMDMVRGRAVSREELQSHAAGGEVLRGLMRVANSSEETQKNRLNKLVKTFVKGNTYYDIYDSLNSYKDIDLMDKLLADDSISITDFSTSLATFNEMDKVAYQNVNAKFGIGVSMYSDTTQNYEYMNEENSHGWYTSDGAVYLYNLDLSHYNDNYWATVDPYHIPGTTIIPTERKDGSGMVRSPNSFIGATKLDDTTASIVMEFTNWDKTLNANKSWFIFNDKVVFLGSDIQTTGDTQPITTIENRKNTDTTQYDVYVNGDKQILNNEKVELKNVHSLLLSSPNNQAMNIGYIFLDKTSLDFLNKTNQGRWKDINASQSDQLHENNFLTFYKTHSKEDTRYAYVMYPNVSNDELAKKEESNKVKILQNNASVQAVYDADEESWGVVLYEDMPFEIDGAITLTKKGVYSIKKKDEYRVSYFNPSDEEYHSDTIETILSQEIVQEATNKDKSTIIRLSIDKDTRKALKDKQKEKEKQAEKDKQKKDKQLEKEKRAKRNKNL